MQRQHLPMPPLLMAHSPQKIMETIPRVHCNATEFSRTTRVATIQQSRMSKSTCMPRHKIHLYSVSLQEQPGKKAHSSNPNDYCCCACATTCICCRSSIGVCACILDTTTCHVIRRNRNRYWVATGSCDAASEDVSLHC